MFNQLAEFALVINIVLRPTVLFIEYLHNKPTVFREGTLVLSFVYI
jgi:hypothetical protein